MPHGGAPGSSSLMSAPCLDARCQRAVLGRIDDVRPGPEDGDAESASGESAAALPHRSRARPETTTTPARARSCAMRSAVERRAVGAREPTIATARAHAPTTPRTKSSAGASGSNARRAIESRPERHDVRAAAGERVDEPACAPAWLTTSDDRAARSARRSALPPAKRTATRASEQLLCCAASAGPSIASGTQKPGIARRRTNWRGAPWNQRDRGPRNRYQERSHSASRTRNWCRWRAPGWPAPAANQRAGAEQIAAFEFRRRTRDQAHGTTRLRRQHEHARNDVIRQALGSPPPRCCIARPVDLELLPTARPCAAPRSR